MVVAPIPFFTDENIPDSVGRAIKSAGHELTRLQDCMARGSADHFIGLICARNGHVLVSQDNDFKNIAKRFNITQADTKRLLHRIDLRCEAVRAAGRIRDLMSLIEHEWWHARALGQPLLVEVRDSSVWVAR